MSTTTDIDVGAFRKAEYPIESMILHRWSPRAMSGDAVSDSDLLRLFEAARWAPSSYNSQPWRFIYARRGTPAWDTFFDLLIDANRKWCHKAAFLVLMVAHNFLEATKSPSRTHRFDAGAAWMAFALQGARMGLVIHGMQGFDWERARTVLAIPDDFDICSMAAVGRPGRLADLDPSLHEREKPNGRKRVSEFVFEGAFRKT
jgi:nitroreductase